MVSRDVVDVGFEHVVAYLSCIDYMFGWLS